MARTRKEPETSFLTWVYGALPKECYRGGRRHAWEYGARKRLLGGDRFDFLYVRSDFQNAERAGFDAADKALASGLRFRCDHCKQLFAETR